MIDRSARSASDCGPTSRRARGSALTEYYVVTGMLLIALLLPFGDGRTALQRLMDAIRGEHAGFLFAAGLPSLPHGKGFAEMVSDGSGSGSSGGSSGSSGSPDNNAGGHGTAGGTGGTSGSTTGDGGTGGGGAGGGGTGGTSGGGSGGTGGGGAGGGEPGGGTGGGTSGGSAGGTGGGSNPGGGTGGGTGSSTGGEGGGSAGGGGTGSSTGGGAGGDPGGEPGGSGPGAGADGPGNGQPQMCAAPSQNPEDEDNASPVPGASQPTSVAATHVGNPIHVVTGNKYQQEIDLSLPKLSGPGLGFVRHYNSRSQHVGALGRNWRHNYETRILDQGDRLYLWQADGRRVDFNLISHTDGQRHFDAAQFGDGRLSAGGYGYQWHWRDDTVLAFDTHRRLQAITDGAGRSTRLSYDRTGRLIAIHDDHDRRIKLEYDQNHRLARVIDPKDTSIEYRYSPSNTLERVDYADQNARLYHYEDPSDHDHLTGISVVNNAPTQQAATRIASWSYDGHGRAISAEHAEGSDRVTLSFKDDHTEVVNASGVSSRFYSETINSISTIRTIQGPGCTPCSTEGDLSYAYNERAQLTKLTRADGRSAVYDYDDRGRLTRVSLEVPGRVPQLVARLSYRGEALEASGVAVPSIKPGAERSIQIHYAGDGAPAAIVEQGFAPRVDGTYVPITRRQRFELDAYRRLTAISGPREDVKATTRVQWIESGTAKRIEFADGGSLGVLTRDEFGRATTIQSDDRQPLNLHYNQDNRIAAVSSHQGRLNFEYNAAGDLKSIGRARERVSERADQHTPPDAHGPALGDDPSTARDGVIIDGNGRPTRYGIDDFGRTVFVESPDTGLTTYDHDEADNLRIKTLADGRRGRFDYDAADRLIAAHWGDTSATMTWDASFFPARSIEVSMPDGSEHRRYDDAGRVVETTRQFAGQRYRSRYRYDAQGRLTALELPGGRRIGYRYHEEGPNPGQLAAIVEDRRLRQDIPLISGLNDEGPASTHRDWRAFNGVSTTIRTEAERLIGLRVEGLHDFTYRYVGELLTGIDDVGQITARYRYDAQRRLDFALTPQTLYGYRYDTNGNRIQWTVNGRQTQYDYQLTSNRLMAVRLTSDWMIPMRVSEDALAGNLSLPIQSGATGEVEKLGSLHFKYNANGQPEEIWNGDTRIVRYQYNSQAQRISKQRYDQTGQLIDTRHYLYEGTQLIAEAQADREIAVHYVYLGHHPIAMLTQDQTYAIHTNHLGAPIAVTDASKTLVWQADYAPFGRARIDEDPDGDGKNINLNLRLPGQYEDSETGLYYNHHRYYDPDLGRYLQSDPIGLAGGLNTYAYAANDPIRNIDPSGLLLFAFDGTGNNKPPEGKSDISNVVRFFESYGDQEGFGQSRQYINGAGTGYSGAFSSLYSYIDAATGSSMPRRIKEMSERFFEYVEWLGSTKKVSSYSFNVDIVGFSRGAAQARMFANLLSDFLDGKAQHHIDKANTVDFNRGSAKKARDWMLESCINVALRFLGLFDTVPHAGLSEGNDIQDLRLEIPQGDKGVKVAVHAIAANEDRAAFDAVSIHQKPGTPNSTSRQELGFIGAHSDIGGGYAEGDLSDVAFMWMIQKAEGAGVLVDQTQIKKLGWNAVASPVIHDSVNASPLFYSGRKFKYLDGSEEDQRQWSGYGMDAQMSVPYFDRRYVEECPYSTMTCEGPDGKEQKGRDNSGDLTLVGMVGDKNRESYSQWLKENYQIHIPLEVSKARLDESGRPLPVERYSPEDQ